MNDLLDPASAPPRKKRSLGQNFLKNPDISRRIVQGLAVSPADHILEIGPGAGALSQVLAEKNPARLVLLEKDRYWAARHAEWARRHAFRYCPVLMDALDFVWEKLDKSWKIVGNLPYNVASPLIWDIVSRASFSLAVFMVQKEVGQRLSASPACKEYGGLSVWVQSFCRVERLFIVPPGAFDPPPKVDSAVMRFTPLNRPMFCAPHKLSLLLKACFQQRRKQMRNILKSHWKPEAD
ncbi:MAG: ribosomal RNA small subunit methyltransferase A, partial [Desulfovibrionaceae bacterium]|nr:ribosomal RNA small subunit methyltransferase A [Desulfovibrionaceae bacterium]